MDYLTYEVKEWADGTKMYYLNGKLHREGDKPAVERADGGKMYCLNGELHREGDKPAIEYANGDKFYYLNDELHREGDKPAIEYADGYNSYYLNGVKYTPTETKELTLTEIEELLGYPVKVIK